jgi:hypothetical protein
MISGALLLAALVAGQDPAAQAPVPTPSGPPEPEIVTLAATPAPTPSVSRPPAAAPTPTPRPPATPAPAPPLVRTVPVTTAPVTAAPAAATPKPAPPASSAADAGRVPVLRSRDWAGKTPVYAIHFSSFQKRENSARHAAELSKRLKLPARPVAVDLGAKGTWYRTMVGEFATPQEAQRALESLPEDVAHGAGGVYRIQAP